MTDYETLKTILWDAQPTVFHDELIDKNPVVYTTPAYPALELESRLMIFTPEGKYKYTTSRY